MSYRLSLTRGISEEFERLYREHASFVYRVALHLTRNAEEAEAASFGAPTPPPPPPPSSIPPVPGTPQSTPPPMPLPPLGAALREQLGLKLEPARMPIEILVIESVERPSEK